MDNVDNSVGYTFHFHEKFFTLKKNYALVLGKDKDGIHITKQYKKNATNDSLFDPAKSSINQEEQFSGRVSAEGIENQLANVKQVVFEVTDACNLQCTYCAYGKLYNDYDIRNNQYIDFNKAKLLIDYILEQSLTALNRSQRKDIMISFYGGEPLLNMNFIRSMVAYLQPKETGNLFKFKYNMTTNGVYLKKYLDFLIRHNFKLLVSLDGTSENNRYRKYLNGRPSFKTIYDNLSYVRDHHPDYFKDNVSFNTVLHNLNNEQESFLFFKQKFGKIPMFSDINDMGIKPDMQQEFNTIVKKKEVDNTSDVREVLVRDLDLESGANRDLRRFIFQYSGNMYQNYNSLLRKQKSAKYIPTGTCFPFNKKVYMTVTGKILPCERIGHQFSLGKVTEDGVEIDCEEIAHKYNAYYDKLQKQCTRCYRAENCLQCIFNINNLDKKPVCPEFTSKAVFENYLRNKIGQLYMQPVLYKRIMEEVTLE